MLKHATLITTVGMILLIIGVLTFFLNMVGVDLYALAWLYLLDPFLSFMIRILFVIIGLILVYVGRTNWDVEDASY